MLVSKCLKGASKVRHIRRGYGLLASLQEGEHSGVLTREQILTAPSSPTISPSYPRGPYTFKNREYFIVLYESDPAAIRKVVPAPLKPASNIVAYEWIRMPDSTGFGDYTESGTVIPVEYEGKQMNFTTQMFLNDEPPIAAGREIWGFPKKYALPKFGVCHDTVFGTLDYGGQRAANGTMAYKYQEIPKDEAIRSLTKTNVNLKLIPGVNFNTEVAQLVSYNIEVLNLKGAWQGPARLELIPHSKAPTADLPVKRIKGGYHYLADIVLPYGNVLYDYVKESAAIGGFPAGDPNTFSEKMVMEHPIMPAISPSYTKSPTLVLKDRELLVFVYRTDFEYLRTVVPEHMTINKHNHVILQWVTTKGDGLGSYAKCEMLVPVTYNGHAYLYQICSFVDNSSAITLGREVLGLPHKFGHPSLSLSADTLAGKLQYSGFDVAVGTMNYDEEIMELADAYQFLQTPMLNLKMIPDVDGKPLISQLLKYVNVNVKSAYKGPGRLHLVPHANAPIADFPVLEIIKSFHVHCDLVMPVGKVEHDYLKE